MSFPILSIIMFVPLIGVLLVLFLPKDNEKLIKRLSIIVSLIPLALSVVVWLGYDKAAGGMQY